MHRLLNMIAIGRPVNEAVTLISVLTAGLLLRDVPPMGRLVIAALGAAFVCGFGNAVNDSLDHAIDRINRPNRLIPSGLISVRRAYAAAVAHLIVGLALTWAVNLTCFLMAAAIALLLIGYSLLGKKLVVIANIWVAAMAASSFVYAAAVGESWEWSQVRFAMLGLLLAFLFHLGREIIKDVEDMPGDSAQGGRTLPIMYGADVAKATSVAVFAVTIVIMILAYFQYSLSLSYLFSALVLLAVPLAWVSWRLVKHSDTREYRKAERMLKYLMPVGLAVLLIARYVG